MITVLNVFFFSLVLLCVVFAIRFLSRRRRNQQLKSAVTSCIATTIPQISTIPHIEVVFPEGKTSTLSGIVIEPLEVNKLPMVIRLVGPSWHTDLNLNITLRDSTKRTERYQFHEEARPQLEHEIHLDSDIIEPYDSVHIFVNEWIRDGAVLVAADLVLKKK